MLNTCSCSIWADHVQGSLASERITTEVDFTNINIEMQTGFWKPWNQRQAEQKNKYYIKAVCIIQQMAPSIAVVRFEKQLMTHEAKKVCEADGSWSTTDYTWRVTDDIRRTILMTHEEQLTIREELMTRA